MAISRNTFRDYMRQELTEDGLLQAHSFLIGIAGMRSGKSKLAGMIATYNEHRLICILEEIDQDLFHLYGIGLEDDLRIRLANNFALIE